MSTGAEHYREAERRMAAANAAYIDGNMDVDEVAMALASAQVHATLALAAAQAAAFALVHADSETGMEWRRLIVAKPAPRKPDPWDTDPCAGGHLMGSDPVTNEPTPCVRCGITQEQREEEEQR